MKLILIALLIMAFVPNRSEAHKKKYSAFLSEARALLVGAPKENEVCFSPEEPCDIKLLKFIESAQKSLDVAIYDVNLDELVHALLIKTKTVQVRIIVDRKQAKGRHSLVSLLRKSGGEVRYGHQRGIMHNKFTIVDGRMIETGSFNYTHHAARANNENQIYLSDPKIVERYKARFEELWSRSDKDAGQ